MKHELATLALWSIALVATLLVQPGLLTTLGPLFAVCMIGSLVVVRSARRGSKGAAN